MNAAKVVLDVAIILVAGTLGAVSAYALAGDAHPGGVLAAGAVSAVVAAEVSARRARCGDKKNKKEC